MKLPELSIMQCNIDEKGARFRRVYGILNVMVGVIVGGLAWWGGYWWLAVVSAACLAIGAFMIFEAQKKWCVLRAMGVKTKM